MTPTPTRAGKARVTVASVVAAAALVFAPLVAATPAVAAVTLPDVIPSISGWQATTGTFTAASDVAIVATDQTLSGTAGITRDELATAIPAYRQ